LLLYPVFGRVANMRGKQSFPKKRNFSGCRLFGLAMHIFFKVAGILLGVVAVVVAAGVITLASFDPNEHKARVAAEVKEATGRNLEIAGDIEAKYFPMLGFRAEGVRLGNPEGFSGETFLSVGKVDAGVKVLPLLRREIQFSKIILQEPRIDIIKLADGMTNLKFPQQKKQAARRDFTIEAVKVSGGSITYTDKATGKTVTASPLNLNLPGYAPGKDMDFSLETAIGRNGAAPAQINVDAKVSMEPGTGAYEFRDIDGKIKLGADGQKMDVTLAGNVSANFRTEEIAANDFQIGWKDSNVKGSADIKGFDKPVVNFNVTSPLIDLNDFRKKDASGGEHGGSGILPVEMMRRLTLAGDVSIQELRVFRIRAVNFTAKVDGGNGLFIINPIHAEGYGGMRQARVQVDVRSPVPTLSAIGKAQGLQADQLARDITGDDYVSGVLNADFDLDAAGNTARALRETAGGDVRIRFSDGVIRKWQLGTLINQAIAFFETGQPDANVSGEVQFTSLSGRFIGSNGVFRNDDLVLRAPKSHALGSGNVSLRDMSVDYSLRVGTGDPADSGRHLPIRISGPLSRPGYSLDFKAAATEAIQQQIEKKQKDILDDILGTEPAAGDEKESGDTGNPADLLKNFLGTEQE